MKTLLTTIMISLLAVNGDLQRSYHTDQASSTITIEGTSSLHDWTMDAKNLKGDLALDRNGDEINLQKLQLTIPVKSLQSGKDLMDKNTHEALKQEKFPNINYNLLTVDKVEKTGEHTYTLYTSGKLTVAGVTNTLKVPVKLNFQKDGVSISGTSAFNMSSFKVEPPSFMFGKMKTGDKVSITFKINYKPSVQ